MRNNKGYTLVELLVTLAVFSIVMVSIVTLMSTTANTYGKGQRETELQEEAQIVANQIENLIIDADAKVTGSAATGYVIKHNAGAGVKTEYLKQDGNKIMYSDNGSIWVPLADYVDSFSIEDTSATDNKVAVKVNMSSGNEIVDSTTGVGTGVGQANYSFEKTVYYRNQVESLANFSIAEGSSPAVSTGGSNEYILDVKRFETYNLKALKDIEKFQVDGDGNVIINSTSSAAASCFVCENKQFTASGSNGEEDINGAFVSCSDTTNTNFTASVLSSDGVYVNGYKKDGTLIKVILTMDPVYFDTGAGIFILPQKKEISGQYGSRGLVVDAKGINMYNAIKKGVDVNCDITIYADADNNQIPGGSETKVEFTDKTLKVMTGDANDFTSTPGQSNFPGLTQMNIGICADMNSGGIDMCSNNGFEASSLGGTIKSNKMRYRVDMTFSKGGSSIACPGGMFDVAIRVPGSVD